MSPKLSNLKPREIIRVLEKAGYYIHETGGLTCNSSIPRGLAELRSRITNASTSRSTS